MLPHCSQLTHHTGHRSPATHHGVECLLGLQTKVHPIHTWWPDPTLDTTWNTTMDTAMESTLESPIVPHHILPGHHCQTLAGQSPPVGADARHTNVGQPLLVFPLHAGQVGLVRGGLQSGPGEVVEGGGSVDSVGKPASARAATLPVEGGGGGAGRLHGILLEISVFRNRKKESFNIENIAGLLRLLVVFMEILSIE